MGYKTTHPILNHTCTCIKTKTKVIVVLFLSILKLKTTLAFINNQNPICCFQTIAQTQTIRDTAPEGVRVNYTAYCP